jgi:uncharacterized protein DUF6941
MVTCDAIWRDPGTGKRTILGCFSVLHAQQFPAIHPTMAVHVAITNGRGRMPFTLRLIDSDEDPAPLWTAEGTLDFTDPQVIMEIDFMLTSVTFPKPGVYRFQLFAAGEYLMERRIFVEQLPSPR